MKALAVTPATQNRISNISTAISQAEHELNNEFSDITSACESLQGNTATNCDYISSSINAIISIYTSARTLADVYPLIAVEHRAIFIVTYLTSRCLLADRLTTLHTNRINQLLSRINNQRVQTIGRDLIRTLRTTQPSLQECTRLI